MSLAGFDVSYAQGTTPSLTGKAFAFVRAGYGSGSVDSKWAYHSANVRAAGKVLGAYWFWYLDQNNAEAVATFLATAGSADLLVLDLEGTGHDSTAGHSQARDFIARVHATGRRIGLYHSASGFPALGQDFDWVAAWSAATAPAAAEFWQYRGSPLDLDYFEGDAAALTALIGDPSMALYIQTPAPGSFHVSAGKTAHGLKPADGGFVSAGKSLSTGSGHFDAHVTRLAGTASPSSLIHITDGGLAGLYVSTAEVDETYDPAPVTLTQATLDAAVAAATATLNARLSGVKTKVAAAAADIAND